MYPLYGHFSDIITVDILSWRRRDIQHYFFMVERAIERVQQEGRTERPTPKICRGCRRLKPWQIRVCSSCGGRELEEITCTSASQLAAFMEIITSCDIWPLNGRIDGTAGDISATLKDRTDELYRRGSSMHHCEYGENCIVNTELSQLIVNLRRTYSRCEP